MSESADDRTALFKKVKDVKVAMLTTLEQDGSLRSRPMYTQQVEDAEALWFFTNEDSGKIREITGHQEVNLAYSDPDSSLFVSVSGRASVVDDREKAKELWNPMNEAFFPEGVDDPDLVLLRVDPYQAEYWDAPGSKLRQLFGFVKAAATGEQYDQGENRKVDLG